MADGLILTSKITIAGPFGKMTITVDAHFSIPPAAWPESADPVVKQELYNAVERIMESVKADRK